MASSKHDDPSHLKMTKDDEVDLVTMLELPSLDFQEDDRGSLNSRFSKWQHCAARTRKWTSPILVLWILLLSEAVRGITIPTQAEYVTELGGDESFLGATVGFFSAGRLLATIVLGYFCTFMPYRRIFLMTSILLVIGNVMYGGAGIASSGSWRKYFVLFGRFTLGTGAGTLAIIRAYFADICKPEERTPVLAVAAAVQYAGFAIFPGVGSLVTIIMRSIGGPPGLDSETTPAWIMAVLNIGSIVGILLIFKEPQIIPTSSSAMVNPINTSASTKSTNSTNISDEGELKLQVQMDELASSSAAAAPSTHSYFPSSSFSSEKMTIQLDNELFDGNNHEEPRKTGIMHRNAKSQFSRFDSTSDDEEDGFGSPRDTLDSHLIDPNTHVPYSEEIEQDIISGKLHLGVVDSRTGNVAQLRLPDPLRLSKGLPSEAVHMESVNLDSTGISGVEGGLSGSVQLKKSSGSMNKNEMSLHLDRNQPSSSSMESEPVTVNFGSDKVITSESEAQPNPPHQPKFFGIPYLHHILFGLEEKAVDPWVVRAVWISFLAINFFIRVVLGTMETLGATLYNDVVKKYVQSGATYTISSGTFYCILGIFGTVLVLGLAFFARRIPDAPIFITGLLALLVGSGILIGNLATMHLAQFVSGAAMIWTIGYPLAQSVVVSMFSKVPSSSRQGVSMSWIGSAGSVGRIVGPMIAGVIFQSYGGPATFIFNTSTAAFVLLISLATLPPLLRIYKYGVAA